MTPLLLAATLALVAPAPRETCAGLGPDALRGIGRFEDWDDMDVAGWDRSSFGNAVKRSVFTYRGAYAAGFQTVWGPGSLETVAFLPQTQYTLTGWIGAQEARVLAVRVQDMASGRYLSKDGLWLDGETDAITQDQPSGFVRYSLPFAAEAPGRSVRIEVRSERFGQCGGNGLCDCSPGLCPTGWADSFQLCPR